MLGPITCLGDANDFLGGRLFFGINDFSGGDYLWGGDEHDFSGPMTFWGDKKATLKCSSY